MLYVVGNVVNVVCNVVNVVCNAVKVVCNVVKLHSICMSLTSPALTPVLQYLAVSMEG